MSDPALHIENVKRSYREGKGRLEVLKGVSLTIEAGEVVALLGPSGAGKSTLLHIAGLLDTPDEGRVAIGGVDPEALGEGGRTALRRDKVGFVYQFHHLLPEFTAVENVVLPQRVAGETKERARGRATLLLDAMGLGERLTHRPAELSGGEQQRVAVARALANEPALLLADEPTGNLDQKTSAKVFAELMALVRSEKLGALIATHDLDLAAQMDRIITLEDGLIVSSD
ncbi:MAG: ABC transporter ATP-binding protein [Alphaproteobacteria bacterium]